MGTSEVSLLRNRQQWVGESHASEIEFGSRPAVHGLGLSGKFTSKFLKGCDIY